MSWADQEILKVQEFYLARRQRGLLHAVIKEGVARSFCIQLKQQGTTITARLLPATDLEKRPICRDFERPVLRSKYRWM